MHSEIEKLIDLALADGQITEKERNVILNKGNELGVNIDELEMILEGKIHQLKSSQIKPTKEKVGIIKTCPSCGASVKSFQTNCEDCGHEYSKKISLEIDLNKSIIIGDSMSDMEFGRNAGMKTVYISNEPKEDESIDFNFKSLIYFAHTLSTNLNN